METRFSRLVVLLFSLALSFVLAPGCGGGGGGGGEVKAPFGPLTETSRKVSKGKLPFITTDTFYSAIVGEKTVAGETYPIKKVAYDVAGTWDVTADKKGAEFWVKVKDGGSTAVFGGAADSNVLEVTMDQPLVIDLQPDVGVPQAISGTGTVLLEGETVPVAGGGQGTYTLVSDDETLETGMGSVHGVSHFSVAGSLTGDGVPIFIKALDLTGDIWYHPDYGVLKYDIPMFNTGLTVDEVEDLGTADGDSNTMRKQKVVGPANREFLLDTYKVANRYDADRFQHAKFYMEIRWADETLAKTDTMPSFAPSAWGVPINPELGIFSPMGGEGYFSYELKKSTVSLFHPEENGKGYVYWVAYASQAGKNREGPAGVSYKVRVYCDDFCTGPMRVTARIYYKLTDDVG